MAGDEVTIGPSDLEAVLDGDPPSLDRTGRHAAVAAVFRGGASGTELLFIERAKKLTDPWSGHMALPGGRVDPTDADSHAAAERETWEEVGVDLAGAKRLGSLSSLDGGRAARHVKRVHAHAYWLPGEAPSLALNYEVADALWVPLGVLTDTRRHIDHWYPISLSTWPGIQLDAKHQVVWGLTLRLLVDLFRRLGTPFITLA